MSDKKAEVLMISRLLTLKHQKDLLTWVQLAYTAENSVKKFLGFDVCNDEIVASNLQDISCGKSEEGREGKKQTNF